MNRRIPVSPVVPGFLVAGTGADPAAASLVVFKNDGKMNFTQQVLAHAPIQLIACAAGDLDGSGRPGIVTGGFYSYPPFDRMGRITLWRQKPRPR